MRTTYRAFRQDDGAMYRQTVQMTFTASHGRPLPAAVQEALIDHFREVDHYGLDKVRAVAIVGAEVRLAVAIPPHRMVGQVAHRLKSAASLRMLRDFPAELGARGRSIWRRGYQVRVLGTMTVREIRDQLLPEAISSESSANHPRDPG